MSFVDPACAVKAYEELDKTSFQGRLLHILPAAERKVAGNKGVEEASDSNHSLKGEKDKKRKENASKDFNWSFLYMNVSSISLLSNIVPRDPFCHEGRCCCFLDSGSYEHS